MSVMEAGEAVSTAGKHMIFKVADEEYGLEILKVRELIGLLDITRVPRTKPFIRGLINLRGKVIPVVDLRVKFGMGATETTDQSVIIVVQHHDGSQTLTMGILVDEVVEVLDLPASAIEPPPNFSGGGDEADFILAIGKAERRVIFLIDIGRVLTSADIIQLQRAESSASAE